VATWRVGSRELGLLGVSLAGEEWNLSA